MRSPLSPRLVAAIVVLASYSAYSIAEDGEPRPHFQSGQPLLEYIPEYYPYGWRELLDDEARTEYVKDNQAQRFAGGVAARDWNGDHRTDLAIMEQGRVRMYVQQADGRFSLANTLEGPNNSLLIADINQDGQLDLVAGEVGHINQDKSLKVPELYFRLGPDWTHSEACQPLRIASKFRNAYGFSMGDINLDGMLDWFTTHWTRRNLAEEPHLWISRGGCNYTPASHDYGILGNFSGIDFSFTSTFTDLTNNGYPDLVVASDFETSQYFINQNKGKFTNATNPFVIDDQNGMGSAVADFDNDGLFDWFVTAVWDKDRGGDVAKEVYGTWGGLGNRLYRNTGHGHFENVSEKAGIGDGAWGWGACAADFNNDGHVDIYHVNGFLNKDTKVHEALDGLFSEKASRLFINQGDGTFSEQAQLWGVDEPNEGRSVACFDHGLDGDIDFLYTQAYGPARLFINTLNDRQSTHRNYIGIKLRGRKGNLPAAGAKIYIFPEKGHAQVREIRLGGNFLGQHPPTAHFGLGEAESIKTLLIQWPESPARYTVLGNLEANQWIEVPHPSLPESDSEEAFVRIN